jgi:hypothetical protein
MKQDSKTTIVKQKRGTNKSMVQTQTEIPVKRGSGWENIPENATSKYVKNVVKTKKDGKIIKYKRKSEEYTPLLPGMSQNKTKSVVKINRVTGKVKARTK